MTAHETSIERHPHSDWGVWCTCGWAIHPLDSRRTADQAAEGHKRQTIRDRQKAMNR